MTLDNLATLSFKRGNLTKLKTCCGKASQLPIPQSVQTIQILAQRLGSLGTAEFFNGDVSKGVGEFVESWKRLRRYIAGQTVFQQGSSAASLRKKEQFGRDWFNSLCAARPVSVLTTSSPVGRGTTSVWQSSNRGNRNYESKTNSRGSDSSTSIAGTGRLRSNAASRNS